MQTQDQEPEKSSTPSGNEIFGSFHLNGHEFALAVSFVQEVVNPPEKYTSLPLAPSYLLGLFNLRGAIIPVVDLGSILKLNGGIPPADRKIAILELQGRNIGILFDHTGEIFRSNAEEKAVFENSGPDTVIHGVFKKDDGSRLVQILNVTALFGLKALPKQSASGPTRGRHSLKNHKGIRKQCISFAVGPAKCSLGINEIQEILKVDQLNESALAVSHCIGTINLRGATVPVIDFPAFLRYREKDRSAISTHGDRRVIVMRLETELFGLLVDSVESIVSYYQEDLKSFPVLNPEREDMFAGCISIEGREDILLLEHRRIFLDSEVQEMTHGHNRIYNSSKKAGNEKSKAEGPRRTFITFVVKNVYAIQIDEVREIIDFPPLLLQPPGLAPHCKGVLNLRGELVTIVNAREMYHCEKLEASDLGKVLIFKKEALHFGLVVDSVEAIVSFAENQKIKLPEVLYESSGGLSSDVLEAVQYKDPENKNKSILILNADSIAARVAKAA